MAIITLSRQVGARGDEVAQEIEKLTGYKFITRKDVEKRIVELGFNEAKMPKYDERNPGFFASLAKDRDLYINLTHYAMLEEAAKNNCIFIGRGSFALFKQFKNNVSVRIVADEKTRIKRLMDEKSWNEKQALQRISESDANRTGFHKNFYNVDVNNPDNYHMVLNTALLSDEEAATYATSLIKKVSAQDDAEGIQEISLMCKIQGVLNKILQETNISIEFLHANIEGEEVVIYGVTDSCALIERVLTIFKQELPGQQVRSSISLIQSFKTYQ